MIVIDDFVKDKSLLQEVRDDASFFPESMGSGEKIATELNSYHYEQASCFAPYMFWDGWWSSPANTLKKRVIKTIWENFLPCSTEEIAGFEYWTRTYVAGQYLDIHVDEDTFLYAKNKTYSGPEIGCVYYGVDNIDGGFLEIHKMPIPNGTHLALEKENIKAYLSPDDEIERIRYRGNRLVIFDAGHVVHKTTPAKSGIRQVMVVNVWKKDNLPTALQTGDFFYE